VAFPVVVAATSAALGAWIGHLAYGTSREKAREIGRLLETGNAGLMVVGIDQDADHMETVVSRSKQHILHRLPDSDWETAEQDCLDAMHKIEATEREAAAPAT
jgi:hypothetical protein